MVRVRVRIRPVEELSDLDPLAVDIVLRQVEGIRDVQVWDERISDALFLTLFIFTDSFDDAFRARLARALCHLNRMVPFIVNARGDETPLPDASTADWNAAADMVEPDS
ncbi:hypothetical protein [Rhodococcus koreensis]